MKWNEETDRTDVWGLRRTVRANIAAIHGSWLRPRANIAVGVAGPWPNFQARLEKYINDTEGDAKTLKNYMCLDQDQ